MKNLYGFQIATFYNDQQQYSFKVNFRDAPRRFAVPFSVFSSFAQRG